MSPISTAFEPSGAAAAARAALRRAGADSARLPYAPGGEPLPARVALRSDGQGQSRHEWRAAAGRAHPRADAQRPGWQGEGKRREPPRPPMGRNEAAITFPRAR